MVGPESGDVRMDHEAYVRLIRQLDELVVGFQNHPDEPTRERVLALLGGLDMLHRSALHRLVEGLREHGAGPALDRVATDPVVETLLALYDLAELDIPEAAPAPAPGGAVGFVPREQLTVGRRAGRSG